MPVRFILVENGLTKESDDYTAQVQYTSTVTLQDIISDLVAGGVSNSPEEIEKVYKLILESGKRRLLEGSRVIFDGLCGIYPTITGTFRGADDQFDPLRHRLEIRCEAAYALREGLRQETALERVASQKPGPLLESFDDLVSGNRNESMTSGGLGLVIGNRLKLDKNNPDEGVFFVPADGGPVIRVEQYHTILPKRLLFVLPVLSAGAYVLEVRARMNGAHDLRIGRLQRSIES